VDLERVVGAAEGLTAADLGEIWNRAAQRAFERDLTSQGAARVTTDDLLAAVETHRPSLSPDDLAAFEQQVREFARI
jgi:SpoVK/Ycf46/Vps4 family AAA+-type ATPase